MNAPTFRVVSFRPLANLSLYSWHKVWRAAGFPPRRSGKLYTRGRGDDGRHGLGDTACHHEPTLVAALSAIPVTQISVGHSHGLALTGACIASLFCSHACPMLQPQEKCSLGGATTMASLVWATPRISWRRFQWRPCGDAG